MKKELFWASQPPTLSAVGAGEQANTQQEKKKEANYTQYCDASAKPPILVHKSEVWM